MLDLFNQFSFNQILIFTVILILAIKEGFVIFDFFYTKVRKCFNSDYEKKTNFSELCKRIDRNSTELKEVGNNVQILKEECQANFKRQDEKIQLLTESDKDDIRSWIVQQHHYFTQQLGCIDDFSLDSIEKRFTHYVEEGGNSYIENLVKELRQLPKHKFVSNKADIQGGDSNGK